MSHLNICCLAFSVVIAFNFFLFCTVNKYLSSENPLFFELRARYLIACERIPEAMALIKSCINHPDISKDLYFHQALFTCLYMSPLEDQLFQEVWFVSIRFVTKWCIVLIVYELSRGAYELGFFVELNVIKSDYTTVA